MNFPKIKANLQATLEEELVSPPSKSSVMLTWPFGLFTSITVCDDYAIWNISPPMFLEKTS